MEPRANQSLRQRFEAEIEALQEQLILKMTVEAAGRQNKALQKEMAPFLEKHKVLKDFQNNTANTEEEMEVEKLIQY